eukprot:273562-Rhodomonas_salina.1
MAMSVDALACTRERGLRGEDRAYRTWKVFGTRYTAFLLPVLERRYFKVWVRPSEGHIDIRIRGYLRQRQQPVCTVSHGREAFAEGGHEINVVEGVEIEAKFSGQRLTRLYPSGHRTVELFVCQRVRKRT